MPQNQSTCVCGDSACTIPFGLCHCGCGVITPIAKYTVVAKRSVAGRPKMFAPYHHLRAKRGNERVLTDGSTRTLDLGNGLFATVDADDYDKVKGFLYHAHHEGKNTYAIREVLRGTRRMKIRLHWDILQKPPRGHVIDHRNGNGLDNSKANLRPCANKPNTWNHRLSSRNKSGYSGVRFDNQRRKWIVTISVNGKAKHIGIFPENAKHAAIACRLAAENLYYGEYAPQH